MAHLCITVNWLDTRYHGLLDRAGPPEWPPSPFRLFQALVAGMARSRELDSDIGKSLEWLEILAPPLIIAPRASPGQVVTHYVPNNDGDKVPDRQNRLTGKTSRPTLMLDPPRIHYLWALPEGSPLVSGVLEAARSLCCLGLGIDMAYATGEMIDEAQIGELSGVRWLPKPDTLRDDGSLRVPVCGSLADLRRAHLSALGRIEHGKPLRTVDKPGRFGVVFYSSPERPLGRPFVVFALRRSDGEWYRYPHSKLIHIAGMTRSSSIRAMMGYPPEALKGVAIETWIDSFVAGHRQEGMGGHEQFSYVPLPSIGDEHADAMIRRVMIVAPFGHEPQLRHLSDQLDGERLKPEGGGDGPFLDRIRVDGVTGRYLGPSMVWDSVTPVILPGHDDHKPAKTVKLIERALAQSGVEQQCEFTWSAQPTFKNCLTTHKYDQHKRHAGYFRPDHLDSLTAVHIRVRFECPVTGPLTVGSGRHCGLGVLAANS